MKLKEKLATDMAEAMWIGWGDRDGYQRGFLAGFDKARLLIYEEVKKWIEETGVIPQGTSYYSELTFGCILDAGEEEIE